MSAPLDIATDQELARAARLGRIMDKLCGGVPTPRPAPDERECVERVMTMHWTPAGCRCPVCQYGIERGWDSNPAYLDRAVA